MTNCDSAAEITLLDRVYTIKCPLEKQHALMASAKYLDEQARKIQQASNATNMERILVVAALNITQELMALKDEKNHLVHLQERIVRFLEKKEAVMAEC